eukprot:564604-Prorocentrum_minimum.AAC.2
MDVMRAPGGHAVVQLLAVRAQQQARLQDRLRASGAKERGAGRTAGGDSTLLRDPDRCAPAVQLSTY